MNDGGHTENKVTINCVQAQFWLKCDNFLMLFRNTTLNIHCLCLDPSLIDTAISIINATYRIRLMFEDITKDFSYAFVKFMILYGLWHS